MRLYGRILAGWLLMSSCGIEEGFQESSVESDSLFPKFQIPCQEINRDNAPFRIDFDYRFDGGYFQDHPERQNALESAALLWQRIITEDQPDRNPESIKVTDEVTDQELEIQLSEPIDDILVFVFAFSLSSPSLKAYGGNRYERGDMENSDGLNKKDISPYTGYITFNTNPNRSWFFDQSLDSSDDIPRETHYDFISTAAHELGHVLGFLTSEYDEASLREGNQFIGHHAMAWNEGAPIPLEEDSSHIDFSMQKGLRADLNQYHTMHGSVPEQGVRWLPTILDAKMLQDIGYDIEPNCVPSIYEP